MSRPVEDNTGGKRKEVLVQDKNRPRAGQCQSRRPNLLTVCNSPISHLYTFLPPGPDRCGRGSVQPPSPITSALIRSQPQIRPSTHQSNPNCNKPGNDRSVSFRQAGWTSYSRAAVSCCSTRHVRSLPPFSSRRPIKWFYGRHPTHSFFPSSFRPYSFPSSSLAR